MKYNINPIWPIRDGYTVAISKNEIIHPRKNKGITLIALVITIIVLLILAGVSIAMLTGDNGILNQANKAKTQTIIANAKEQAKLDIIAWQSDKLQKGEDATLSDSIIKGILSSGDKDYIETVGDTSFITKDGKYEISYSELYSINSEVKPPVEDKTVDSIKDTFVTRNTEVKDEYGNKIVVPDGFKIRVDNTTNNASHVTEGVVIEDGEGNQFVWIPVGNIKTKINDTVGKNIELNRYSFASNGTASEYTGVFKEENSSDTANLLNYGNTIAKDINAFKASVNNNGGYYFARYEASYGADGKPNSKISTGTPAILNPATRAEGMLWNWITQQDAATASRNMYNSSNYTSDLVNSYAWDTAIVFIQTFSDKKNYSNQKSLNADLANTGTNGDNPLNVNDMASNVAEWTTETSSTSCTVRGGFCYDSNYYASYRTGFTTTSSSGGIAIRPILYL